VCDVFDALRTNRPYRAAWELDRVLSYIVERGGMEFDPDIVKVFVPMMQGLERRMQMSVLEDRGSGPGARVPGDTAGTPPVQAPAETPFSTLPAQVPSPAPTAGGTGNPSKPTG
jgi:hypothetical protein